MSDKENIPRRQRSASDTSTLSDFGHRPTFERRASGVKLVRQNSNVVGPILVEVQDDSGNVDFPHIDEPEDDSTGQLQMMKWLLQADASLAMLGNQLTLDDVEEKIAPIMEAAETRKKELQQLLVEHASLVAKINTSEGSVRQKMAPKRQHTIA
ncbi:PREDICTED: uncharacterized protein LOC106816269 isoform X1 [Priapulus caudatus]|uniref:Uncharacterized protein LOC106816269 isoform X1 n=1 Tax=Priapulus caudatus TaxID=37621 RepID=A0ABM1EVW5_PRICU|nr:PREDICTED: uncharacterized protein LOC106816269 isoform X1 [Priapulus caudatus]